MSPQRDMSYDQQIAAVLRGLPVYGEASPEQIDRLARKGVLIPLRKGQALFRMGEIPRFFHDLVSGSIHFLWNPPGSTERRVAFVLGPGDAVADAATLLGQPYKIVAEAACDSLVLALPREEVLGVLREGGPIVERMLERTSRLVLALVREIETLTLRSGSGRVATYLLDAAPAMRANRYEVRLPTSKQALASLLNLSKESFSRILKEFRDQGLIDVSGRVITVLNREGLSAVGRGQMTQAEV